MFKQNTVKSIVFELQLIWKGLENNFREKPPVDSADTLRVKKFVERALFL